MASAYPTAADNLSAVGTNHGNVSDAVAAVEATLGLSPQGASATVAARLTAMTASIGGPGDPVRSSTKIKCYTYDPYLNGNVSGASLVSGTIFLCKLPLFSVETLTGMIIPIITTGNYTAASTGNRVGLYRSDGTDMTLVASSAEDGTLWKGATSSNSDRAFTTPYTPSAVTEHLYGAIMYRNSAQTTAPAVPRLSTAAALIDIGAVAQHRTGNISTQTDLPSTFTVAMASWVAGSGQILYWMGAY